MFDLLQSLFIGMAISAIPGPLFFEIVRRVLTQNFWSGISISFGDFVGNLLLLSLIFIGVSTFLTGPIIESILFFSGSMLLIWLAIDAFRVNQSEIELSYKKKFSSKNSILVGLLIAISSPIVIAFWISLAGSYLARFDTHILAFAHIFLIALGFVFFHLLLAAFLNITKHKIASKYVVLLSRFFGTLLLGFGIYFIILLVTQLRIVF